MTPRQRACDQQALGGLLPFQFGQGFVEVVGELPDGGVGLVANIVA